jgi:DNA-binding NarL/FixJ family response regulator
MTQPIRVLIADDSSRARAGLRTLLATEPDIVVVGEASNGREAVHLAAERRPAVVLMDLQMPLLDGAQATRLIKDRWPSVVVVVVTMHADEEAVAIAAGADAFVVKGDAPERVLAALRTGHVAGKP